MHIRFDRRLVQSLLICLFFILSISFIAFKAIYNLKASFFWVEHTQKVMENVNSVSLKINLRGNNKSIQADIVNLKKLVADNQSQKQKVEALHQKFSQLEDIHQEPYLQRQSIQICNTILDDILLAEKRLLIERKQRSESGTTWAYGILLIAIILSIAFLIFIFYLVRKYIRVKKTIEDKLRLSERKLTNTFNFSSIGKAILSEEGEWLDVNPALCLMLGYDKDELLGFSFKKITYPEDLKLDLENWGKMRSGEIDNYQIEKRYIHKGGHLIKARLFVSIVRGVNEPSFIIAQVTDITAIRSLIDSLQEKNKEIKHYEQELRTFIEYSPASICMVDSEMNFIVASKVWQNNHLLDTEDIAGKNLYAIFPNLEPKWIERHQQALKGNIVGAEEDSYINQKGELEWVKWQFKPWYRPEGKIGGIIISSEIITDQYNAKQELIKAKEEAERAARIKSEFLSTMSHEIRTPMNAVIGFTNILLQDARKDQVEYLNLLRFSGQNLLVLINDILDFNKIEAGQVQFEHIDFNLKELVLNVNAGLKAKADDKRIGLDFIWDDQLDEMVIGDPVRLSQVLTNLISNAVKFTETGKVTVSVSVQEQKDDETFVKFLVQDTGIGIPQDKQGYIFDSFTQASIETTRKYGGTGLGLAISKKLV